MALLQVALEATEVTGTVPIRIVILRILEQRLCLQLWCVPRRFKISDHSLSKKLAEFDMFWDSSTITAVRCARENP